METEILFRHFAGKATRLQQREISQWLSEDSDGNRHEEYRLARMMFEGLLMHCCDIAEAHVPKPSFSFKKTFAAAAAFVIAVSAGILAGRLTIGDDAQSQTITLNVPAGQSLSVTMGDGTEIWLNCGSTLEYPTVFGKDSRKVRLLDGEAFFKISEDPNRPFTVETFASDIMAMGTEFNVSAYEDRGVFSATLIEGKISVTPKSAYANGKEYILGTNESVTLKNGRMEIGHIPDPSAVTCWKDGLINVSGVPFDELMERFESAFDVSIAISRDDIPQIRYTRGKIRISEGIDHALAMLQLVTDFTWYRRADTIIIK